MFMTNVKFPLSVFDFFAYLIQGFLLLVGFCYLFKINILEITTTDNLFFDFIVIVLSYILGHIVAELSRWIIEGGIVRKYLGYPSDFVFKEEHRKKLLFTEYLRPYSKEFINEFKTAYGWYYNNKFSRIDDYNSFRLCFHTVKERCPNAFSRLEVFISMYDFNRNLSMVSIVYGGIFLTIVITTGELIWLLGVALSLILTFMLLLRYLKFFKSFADEVYYSFLNYVMEKKDYNKSSMKGDEKILE